jgi:hypothetical protein
MFDDALSRVEANTMRGEDGKRSVNCERVELHDAPGPVYNRD